MPIAVLTLLVLAIGFQAFWQAGNSPDPGQTPRTSIRAELFTDNKWQPVDIRTVFSEKDRIRFKYHSSTSRNLYILDDASSGAITWLYPPQATVSQTRLRHDVDVTIPSDDEAYQIEAPPGVDTLYWIQWPHALRLPEIRRDQLDSAPSLLSRCAEEMPQTKDACLSNHAGPTTVSNTAKLLSALHASEAVMVRDLHFESSAREIGIWTKSNDPTSGIVYEIRIVHH